MIVKINGQRLTVICYTIDEQRGLITITSAPGLETTIQIPGYNKQSWGKQAKSIMTRIDQGFIGGKRFVDLDKDQELEKLKEITNELGDKYFSKPTEEFKEHLDSKKTETKAKTKYKHSQKDCECPKINADVLTCPDCGKEWPF